MRKSARRMNSTINMASWYEMYPKMGNMSSNENIQISMIWGSLFDEKLEIQGNKKENLHISRATEYISFCFEERQIAEQYSYKLPKK